MPSFQKQCCEIEKLLDHARKMEQYKSVFSLYDLLNLSPSSPANEIKTAIRSFMDLMMSRQGNSKWQGFAILALKYAHEFESVLIKNKDAYNEYLKVNDPRVKSLHRGIDLLLSGNVTFINPDQVSALLAEAEGERLSHSVATEIINARLRQKGVSVKVTPPKERGVIDGNTTWKRYLIPCLLFVIAALLVKGWVSSTPSPTNHPSPAATAAGSSGVPARVGAAPQERFIAKTNGIVLDTKTNLEWLVKSKGNTTWKDLLSWIDGLNHSLGFGWRVPSRTDLKTLMNSGSFEEQCGSKKVTFHINSVFSNGCWSVWTSDSFEEDYIFNYYYKFSTGESEKYINRDNCGLACPKAFAVRPRR